jgi:hypothetical protein
MDTQEKSLRSAITRIVLTIWNVIAPLRKTNDVSVEIASTTFPIRDNDKIKSFITRFEDISKASNSEPLKAGIAQLKAAHGLLEDHKSRQDDAVKIIAENARNFEAAHGRS